jgi:hypothetical protein
MRNAVPSEWSGRVLAMFPQEYALFGDAMKGMRIARPDIPVGWGATVLPIQIAAWQDGLMTPCPTGRRIHAATGIEPRAEGPPQAPVMIVAD